VSDSFNLVDALRGKYAAKCKCHARSSGDCACSDTLWPEDVAREAANLIETLETRWDLVKEFDPMLYERISLLEKTV
jgi:hypothetical protein